MEEQTQNAVVSPPRTDAETRARAHRVRGPTADGRVPARRPTQARSRCLFQSTVRRETARPCTIQSSRADTRVRPSGQPPACCELGAAATRPRRALHLAHHKRDGLVIDDADAESIVAPITSTHAKPEPRADAASDTTPIASAIAAPELLADAHSVVAPITGTLAAPEPRADAASLGV